MVIDALLIANPAAGSGPRWSRAAARFDLDRVLTLLRSRFEIEVETSMFPGHAEDLAREAAASGREVVFALGGDGTAREVAAGLLGSASQLALLPVGTTNVLPAALGLPRDATACARRYLDADPTGSAAIDVGLCGDRPFLMMASRGFDADVLARLSPRRKKRWGRLGVVAQGIGELLRHRPRGFEIELEDGGQRSSSQRAELAAACNIAQYGGRFLLAPDASPHDGLLDVVLLERSSRMALLGLALRVAGGVRRRPGTPVRRTPELFLHGSGPVTMQLDGDPLELRLPLRVRLLPGALRILGSAASPDPRHHL
ncbi:MAG: hypothetical protein DWQ30_10970 [Acidobacteria bacterium]|nr:MAG: hypothetical protein DWQ30_10970 [Acidobacteriota bacterium]